MRLNFKTSHIFFTFLTFLFFINLNLLYAQTYYVNASGGSDNNDGTSPTSPWKTISKVNKAILIPGTIIKFKRGEIWREMLQPTQSGQPNKRIVFTTYGTGESPIITGADLVSGTWTNVSGNLWSIPMATAPQAIYFIKNGTEYWGYNAGSTANVNSDFKWYYTSGALYVYATSNPSSYYNSVENAVRTHCVNPSGNYQTYDSLHVRFAYRYGFRMDSKDSIEIGYCKIHHNGTGFNTGIGEGVYNVSRYSWIHDNEIYENGIHGNYNGTFNTSQGTGALVEYNNIYNNYHGNADAMASGVAFPGTDLPTMNNVGLTFRYNKVHFTNPQASLFGVSLSGKGTGFEINAWVIVDPSGVDDNYYVKNVRIYGNVFYNTPIVGINVVAGCDSIYIYNNTIYGVGYQGIILTPSAGGRTQSKPQHIWVYNNIIANTGYQNLQINNADYPSVTDYYHIDNNFYQISFTQGFYLQNPAGGYSTLSGWQNATAFDDNSKSGNPLFTNPSVFDFTLQSGSPAIDAGANLGAPYNVDMRGVSRPQGAGWDIGAFEYNSGTVNADNTPPTLLSATVITPTSIALTFSEPLDINSAQTKSNYSINNGIIVNSAIISADGKTVTLGTTQNIANQTYTVTVTNVKDVAGNIISSNNNSVQYFYVGDSTPPILLNAYVVNPTTIQLTFSEALENLSASNKLNYSINNGVIINNVSLSSDATKVTLSTTQNIADQTYTVTVTNVKDLAGNIIQVGSNTAQYSYIGDSTPPALLSASATNATTVELLFSEALNLASAQATSNYSINNGIIINSVTISSDQKKVTLSTSKHVNNTNYTIVVNNVRDLAGNLIGSVNSAQYVFIDNTTGDLKANVKIFLQGPFSGNSMLTELSANDFLSNTQPYNTAPWFYNGNEVLGSGASVATDWILVELHSSQDPKQVITRRACLLRNDGRVMEPNGTLGVTFNNLFYGSYYIVVRHRNHLAVMSASPVSFSPNNDLYDFTISGNQAYGQNAMIQITPGIFALYAGDGNGDGIIDNKDRDVIWNDQNGNMGYLNGDFNLDSGVTVKDINDFWNLNQNQKTQVP